jgi:hypothetical protein
MAMLMSYVCSSYAADARGIPGVLLFCGFCLKVLVFPLSKLTLFNLVVATLNQQGKLNFWRMTI